MWQNSKKIRGKKEMKNKKKIKNKKMKKTEKKVRKGKSRRKEEEEKNFGDGLGHFPVPVRCFFFLDEKGCSDPR